jgi:predicted nucleic acid-binding protein
MPEDKIFLDTNIIIYAYDRSAGKKHSRARDILLDLWDSGLGVISTQVLQEFFVNVTQKIPNPLDKGTARDIVSGLLKWDIVVNDGETILEGIDIHLRYNYSFWDSLIIGAALRSEASILFSEDLADGRVIQGVRITNPFISP